MPKITGREWSEHDGAPNPISGQDDGPYAEIHLGDAVGLTQVGVRLERLPPGSRSSHRHWHETEDELIYLISGELVLIEDEETILNAGDAAGWKAGEPTAHCLENRSAGDAVMLVLGTRAEAGAVHYPDHDVIKRHDKHGATFTRTDGSPLVGKF
ncbi:cupin domain-containing protein [uncultured Roseobacter sp.]|uniref:cupin domain-containing protein n=1 Tax=uncultured Roseobacter sp. TaxID=114847 RepID=UPI0026074776|nr:cupin domain-containing protein [uncultured Roseobacter sp.]